MRVRMAIPVDDPNDDSDETVATIFKRWLTMPDTYELDVAPGQDDLLLLAGVLALDLAEDQERKQR